MTQENQYVIRRLFPLGQRRNIIFQAKVPAKLTTAPPDVLRGYIGQFLRENLSPELSRIRRQKLGASIAFFTLSNDKEPFILRSIRIAEAMDADLAEYAGLMQLKKRDVAYHAMRLGLADLPMTVNFDADFTITRKGPRSYDVWRDRNG